MSSGPASAPPPDPGPPDRDAARSFARVAEAYDRARPGYPPEAAPWLVGHRAASVLEVGAGTGKLTADLAALGHDVLATDPLPEMLRLLSDRLPDVRTAVAPAEELPLPDRSVDVVVSAQAFHWFEPDRALPEIARVLRPGGQIALVWNDRDERIPWVRRLGRVIGGAQEPTDPTHTLLGSGLFGFVESATFRHWQQVDHDTLRELVASRSNVATMPEADRARVLAEVDALYDEYGRGADGMLLPYVTRCYRATVRARAGADADASPPGAPPVDGDDPDDGDLLIDFS
ncbi:MAG TPA: class I SAM-dependent methyltransferase [Nocardioides sp.]|nr:class I SAM-dependent methyltransferase [Nocardioides sp.]